MRFSKLIRFRDSQLLLTTKLLVLSTLLGFTLNSQAQVSSTGKYSLSIRLSAAPLTHAVFTPGRVLAASRTELVKTPLVIDIGAKASASVTPMAPLRIDIINLASAGAQLKIESLSGGIKSVTGPTPTGAMVCAPNCAAPLLKDKAASFYLSVSMRPDYVGSQKALNESFVIDANGAKIPVTIRGQVFAAPELALYSNFGHYHYFSNQNPTQIPTFDFGQVKVGQDLPFEFMLGRSRVGTVSFSAWLPSNIAGMTRPVSVLGLENPNPSPTSPSVSGKIKALPGTNYIRFQTTAKGLAPQTKIIAW